MKVIYFLYGKKGRNNETGFYWKKKIGKKYSTNKNMSGVNHFPNIYRIDSQLLLCFTWFLGFGF